MLVFSDLCFPVYEQNHILIFLYEERIVDSEEARILKHIFFKILNLKIKMKRPGKY